jgi:hypothetical protein
MTAMRTFLINSTTSKASDPNVSAIRSSSRLLNKSLTCGFVM